MHCGGALRLGFAAVCVIRGRKPQPRAGSQLFESFSRRFDPDRTQYSLGELASTFLPAPAGLIPLQGSSGFAVLDVSSDRAC